jgi:hypothetical protein
MRHVVALFALFLCCTAARAADSPALDDPAALAAAQARIDEGLRAGVSYDAETHELVLDSSETAAAVTAPATFDVQWGSGHGGSIAFVRFAISTETTAIEQVYFRTDRHSRPATWSARRAVVPTTEIVPLVQLARAEARTRVEIRRRPNSDGIGGSFGGSTADFFVLARVTDAHGDEVLEREYCGYPGGSKTPRYAGILVVERAVRAYMDSLSTWADVGADKLRTTHLDAAFAANADLMFRDFHWWVMERSVEALGVFGTRASLPILRRLDAEYEEPQPRQRAKIRNVLGRPDHYLAGKPKGIPETPDASAEPPGEAPGSAGTPNPVEKPVK